MCFRSPVLTGQKLTQQDAPSAPGGCHSQHQQQQSERLCLSIQTHLQHIRVEEVVAWSRHTEFPLNTGFVMQISIQLLPTLRNGKSKQVLSKHNSCRSVRLLRLWNDVFACVNLSSKPGRRSQWNYSEGCVWFLNRSTNALECMNEIFLHINPLAPELFF